MIKINLLPYREEKKKQFIKSQLTVAGLFILPAILLIILLFFLINTKISNTNKQISHVKAEIQKQKVSLDEIKAFKKEKEILKNKSQIIEKLEKGKFGPVHIIDHLAINLPGRIWLTKIEQKNMSMTIDGKALDNLAISDYMVNLTKSDYFKTVDLKKIKTDNKKGLMGIQIKDFSLTSTITYTPGIKEKEEKEDMTKKKKRVRK
jgi:type IV pilus assembly protein PilN